MEKKYIKPTTASFSIEATTIMAGSPISKNGGTLQQNLDDKKTSSSSGNLGKEFSFGYVEENQRGTEYPVYNLWEE